jgi:hypothetical protein
MSSSSPDHARAIDHQSRTPRLGSVVRKSALLNLVVFLTSFPVMVYAAGPKAIVPSLFVMAAISVLIWTATFALFGFASLARIIFWRRDPSSKPSLSVISAIQTGIEDRWLDSPV